MRVPLIVVLVLVTAVGMFLTRPWSDYSPLTMNSLFHADKRIENMRNMNRVFPYRIVKAGDQPYVFKQQLQDLDVRYKFKRRVRSLDEFLERVNATGLLVIQDDVIINEQYRLGATAETQFTSWSVAKSFVSTLVGIALADGRIRSLNDSISTYTPELRGTAYDGVPIRHVLQMTSGIDFDETYDNRWSDINQFFWKVFIFGRRASSVIGDYGSAGPSGKVFHYVSMDTQALAMMLRAVYEQPLTKLLQDRLWQPMGMEGDAYWNIDRDSEDGVELAFCCLNARLRDFAKLGRLHLNHGSWEGRQLLLRRWSFDATKPKLLHLQAEQTGYQNRGYQYQWWSPQRPDGEYFAAGVWGQYVYVSAPDKLIIARSSVDPDYQRNMAESIAVFRAIRDHLRAAKK